MRNVFGVALLFGWPLLAQQYLVTGKVADILRSEEAFRPLAGQVRANVEGALREFRGDDNAVRSGMLSTLLMLDLLEGKNDAARVRMDQIQGLDVKPVARAMSNLTTRAMLDAARETRGSAAHRAAVYASIRGTLDALPFEAIRDEVQALKDKLDVPVREAQLLAPVSAVVDPLIEKNGTLPASVVHGLPGLRFVLIQELPLRGELSEALGAYLKKTRSQESGDRSQ